MNVFVNRTLLVRAEFFVISHGGMEISSHVYSQVWY